MEAPLAAFKVAEVGLIAAPHCLTILLLATPIVHPESGVADTLTLCRDALLPMVQGSRGVSKQGDLKSAGLEGPFFPFLEGAITLHLCLTILALTTLALAALWHIAILVMLSSFQGQGIEKIFKMFSLPKFSLQVQCAQQSGLVSSVASRSFDLFNSMIH